MLSIKQREEELKYLGFYSGKIDGKEGPLLKKAYKQLQDKYFFRKKDKDGKYGKNTDILLQSAYNVKRYAHNFDILKDKLHCRCNGKYCTGYPAIINKNMIINLQKERDFSGITVIHSMLRCPTWNSKSKGVRGSKHTKGKAVDFTNQNTKTLANRKKTVDRWIKMSNSTYSYCNGYGRRKLYTTHPKVSSMGSTVHGDTL
jgi:hypothetical protein